MGLQLMGTPLQAAASRGCPELCSPLDASCFAPGAAEKPRRMLLQRSLLVTHAVSSLPHCPGDGALFWFVWVWVAAPLGHRGGGGTAAHCPPLLKQNTRMHEQAGDVLMGFSAWR